MPTTARRRRIPVSRSFHAESFSVPGLPGLIACAGFEVEGELDYEDDIVNERVTLTKVYLFRGDVELPAEQVKRILAESNCVERAAVLHVGWDRIFADMRDQARGW